MIDFIKLYWQDKNRLQSHVLNEGNFEEVNMVLEKHSSEIKYPYTTHFTGMKVGLTQKSGYVKNSIHKSYNILKTGKEHNYNDFTYSNICEEIEYLSSRLVDLDKSRITQLEFGLNIPIDTPAENIIRRNVIMHKLKGANHNRQYFGRGEFKQFDYHNYVLKIYDKAKQYRLNTNVLRFEVKYIKAIDFQGLGIFNIEDLKNKMKLRKLFLLLLKRFDELTIIDEYGDSEIQKKDLNNLKKYSNPAFWEEELRSKTRQTKSIHKKKFERILNKYSLLEIKKSIRSLIIQKFIYSINN